MCAHTHAHTKRHPYVCTISIAVCACIARRRRLLDVGALRFCFAFGCPANKIRNTKKKKKVVFLLSASLFSSRCSLSLWFFGLRSRLCLSLSRLFSCLLCALLCFCFICYFVVRHFNSRSLARCCRRSRALALAAAAYFASHYSLNERLRSPLPHTHTHTQKHIPLLHHSPLHFAQSLSPHSLDDLHDDATYNSNRLKRKTNKNELNRKA